MSVIEILYASTTLIGLISFIPQLIKLWRDKSGAESTSISTVSMWTFTSVVTLIYALQINGDFLFIFGAGVFTLGNSLVLTLASHNRYFRKTVLCN